MIAIGIGVAVGVGVRQSLKDECADSIAALQNNKEADYGKAVEAIVNSNMWDSYKREALGILKKDETSSYYAGVIAIVKNDDMWDSYKIRSIEQIS